MTYVTSVKSVSRLYVYLYTCYELNINQSSFTLYFGDKKKNKDTKSKALEWSPLFKPLSKICIELQIESFSY